MKNDQYFKLSACIMSNDQVIGLTEELGVEGFGAFVSLLLELRQRDDYRCALRSLTAIARRLNTTQELLLRVVYHFGLFRVDEDEQLFSSPYMDEVMGNLEACRKRQAVNRENGLKGGRPPKCPKEVEESMEKPNSKPIEKPTGKPNSKPTSSETPMNTGRKPNQNPVEKSRVEKRTSTTEEEKEVDVEFVAMELFRTYALVQGTGERLFSSAGVRSCSSDFNRLGIPAHHSRAPAPTVTNSATPTAGDVPAVAATFQPMPRSVPPEIPYGAMNSGNRGDRRRLH